MMKMITPIRAFLKNINFCYYRNYKNIRQGINQDCLHSSIILYDHDCPFCRQEMQRLKSIDVDDCLILLNINSRLFNPEYWGVSREQASQSLHILTAERIWLVGMPAIRYVYAQVGQGWLLAPSGWPMITWLADLLYRYIAPNRYVISHWLGLSSNNQQCTNEFCTMSHHRKR